jgi:hypothetical protein
VALIPIAIGIGIGMALADLDAADDSRSSYQELRQARSEGFEPPTF